MALNTLEVARDNARPADTQGLSPQPLPADLGAIFQRAALADDLAAIEQLLMRRADSQAPLLAAAGAHTIAAGGKRLRAALVLLAARLGDYDLERASHPAAAIELLHAASLVHDDLVDHTGRRRGHVTVHARWDCSVALMLGDYFFALSANELAAEPDPRIIRFYATAAQTIVEGELSPVTQLEPLEVALAQYHHKIGCKTAALFEAACKAGITVAGGTGPQIDALGRFGYNLGLAFQIVDDVLDFTGDERALGKPAGNDLREGTWTLPLIYAVGEGSNAQLRELARTLRPPSPDHALELLSAVIASGGVARALEEAQATAARALAQLADFPSSKTTRALADICDFILSRQT
ncbi:MAG TPA: polyprenyl synthetase family protein [Roseiflexaceae bacterium]|nr:polyprenyl synthetase family protein [Roseiflexaceae bacterium]